MSKIVIGNAGAMQQSESYVEFSEKYGNADDPVNLSSLAEACVHGDVETKRVSTKALCKLLQGSSRALTQEILRALGPIGDRQVIRAVKRLASSRQKRRFYVWPREARDPIFVEAARWLSTLHERVQAEKSHAQLLRPASSLDRPDETLLRTVLRHSDESPQNLLRPIDGCS